MSTREVKVGQVWRRYDPSGITFKDFVVSGFQRSVVNAIDAMVQGRTRGGKLVRIALKQMTEDPFKRFELLEDGDPSTVRPPSRVSRHVRRRPASEWAHPPGTPVILALDNGSKVACRTTSRAWNLAGGHGVVKLTHPHGPWSLERVRVDKSRVVGPVAEGILRCVCAATANGKTYVHTSDHEYRAITREKLRPYLNREGSGGWWATLAAYELLRIEPPESLRRAS